MRQIGHSRVAMGCQESRVQRGLRQRFERVGNGVVHELEARTESTRRGIRSARYQFHSARSMKNPIHTSETDKIPILWQWCFRRPYIPGGIIGFHHVDIGLAVGPPWPPTTYSVPFATPTA